MNKPRSFHSGQLVELCPEYCKSSFYGLSVLDETELKEYHKTGLSPADPVLLVAGRPYEVIKARLKMSWLQHGYPYTRRMVVRCYATGKQFYVQREMVKPLLQPVQPGPGHGTMDT